MRGVKSKKKTLKEFGDIMEKLFYIILGAVVITALGLIIVTNDDITYEQKSAESKNCLEECEEICIENEECLSMCIEEKCNRKIDLSPFTGGTIAG